MARYLDPKYDHIRALIDKYAAQYNVDPEIGYRQLWQESRYNNNAVSPVGAQGIAQFMPATAKEWGVNVYNLEDGIKGWARYMAWILRQSYIGGDYAKALAAYNWGVGNVQRKGIDNLPKETADYLKIILGDLRKNPGAKWGLIIGLAVGGTFLATHWGKINKF